MPRGDKRQAAHIETSYQRRGVGQDTAREIAWATVNKQDGGGPKRKTGSRKKK